MKKTNFKRHAMISLFEQHLNMYKWFCIILTGAVMLTAILILFFLDKEIIRRYEPVSDFLICAWLGHLVLNCAIVTYIERISNRS